MPYNNPLSEEQFDNALKIYCSNKGLDLDSDDDSPYQSEEEEEEEEESKAPLISEKETEKILKEAYLNYGDELHKETILYYQDNYEKYKDIELSDDVLYFNRQSLKKLPGEYIHDKIYNEKNLF